MYKRLDNPVQELPIAINSTSQIDVNKVCFKCTILSKICYFIVLIFLNFFPKYKGK